MFQNPAELEDWLSDLNPHSKEVMQNAYAVPVLGSAVTGDKFQFERLGKFLLPLLFYFASLVKFHFYVISHLNFFLSLSYEDQQLFLVAELISLLCDVNYFATK